MYPLVWILPFLLLVAGRDDDPCTLTTKEGAYYDLSSLKASTDYSIATSTDQGASPLFLNICKPVASETWDLDNPSKVGGFIRRAHGDFSVGQPNSTLTFAAGSVQLYMLEGSTCPSGGKANTIIDFVCDTAIFGVGKPRIVAKFPVGEEDSCSFFLEWRTHVACPTGARSGPWGFFVTIIVLGFLLLMTYLTLGTLYNRFVLNLRGFDQVPSFSIEGFRYHASEALDWFRDVMSGLYEGGQAGRYTLPRTNPVSHQSGVDGGAAGGFAGPGQRNEFVQPGPLATNPVSHQSQINASHPAPAVQPSRQPMKEETRPFLVGDYDEDEGEELTPVSKPATASATPGHDGVNRL